MAPVTTPLLNDMVRARIPWTSRTIRAWYSDRQVTTQLTSWLDMEAARVDDTNFGRRGRDSIGFQGVTDPAEWANRRLDLHDGGWAITGIRFRGWDISRPFVDVVATSTLPTPEGLARVAEAVVPAYARFHPLCLRVNVPDATDLLGKLRGDDRFGDGNAVDMHVVAGQISQLREKEPPRNAPRVLLEPGEPDALVARVQDIYERLAEQDPETTLWATPLEAEALEQCAQEGLLFEVMVDGVPAGVIGAVREDAHGMCGFSVEELCLDEAHRGKGLASAVMRHLVDRLPAEEQDVLWGTIHPSNRPSLRNATGIGRRVVASDVWLTPAGLPGMHADATSDCGGSSLLDEPGTVATAVSVSPGVQL